MISTHIELLEAEEMISAAKPEMINTIYTMTVPSKIITVTSTMIIIRVPLTPLSFCELSKDFSSLPYCLKNYSYTLFPQFSMNFQNSENMCHFSSPLNLQVIGFTFGL